MKRFKFLGPMGAHFFLYVVREEVPTHEERMAYYGSTTLRRRT